MLLKTMDICRGFYSCCDSKILAVVSLEPPKIILYLIKSLSVYNLRSQAHTGWSKLRKTNNSIQERDLNPDLKKHPNLSWINQNGKETYNTICNINISTEEI